MAQDDRLKPKRTCKGYIEAGSTQQLRGDLIHFRPAWRCRECFAIYTKEPKSLRCRKKV